jgi:hypothetical protein
MRAGCRRHVERLAAIADMERIPLVVVGDGPRRAELQRLLPHAFLRRDAQRRRLATAYATLDVSCTPDRTRLSARRCRRRWRRARRSSRRMRVDHLISLHRHWPKSSVPSAVVPLPIAPSRSRPAFVNYSPCRGLPARQRGGVRNSSPGQRQSTECWQRYARADRRYVWTPSSLAGSRAPASRLPRLARHKTTSP